MRAILIAAIAGLASMAAQAQVKESITIRQGQLTVLQLSEAFTEVLVADPAVLDALPKGNQTIVLQAKQPGLTDVLLFGSSGAQRQITVAVQTTVPAGMVLTHNKKDKLSLYTAYVCDPICRRASDPFQCEECAQITTQNTYTGLPPISLMPTNQPSR
jgi:hypothetical protein